MLASFYIDISKLRSKRGLNTKKPNVWATLPMNLEIETLSSLGHNSIGMIAQHWSYHPCRVDISYLAWISFSRSVICSLVMLLTRCNANAKREIKHGCILYDKQMHCKIKSILSSLNPRQASSWWTILHAMSETKTSGSCKTHVHHYLDKVRQAPSTCTYEMHLYDKAIIWR